MSLHGARLPHAEVLDGGALHSHVVRVVHLLLDLLGTGLVSILRLLAYLLLSHRGLLLHHGLLILLLRILLLGILLLHNLLLSVLSHRWLAHR